MMHNVADKDLLEYNMKVDGRGLWVSVILSSVMCLSGVALLIFNPPIWGLTLGLPYTIGGFTLAIITFDRANRPRADSQIDRQDLEDERQFLSHGKLLATLFLVLTLPILVGALMQPQTVTQKAEQIVPSPTSLTPQTSPTPTIYFSKP